MKLSLSEFDDASVIDPEIDPEIDIGHYERGEALASQGRYEEALIYFEQATALNPESVDAWVFRGVALLYLERFEAALDSCDRALAIVSLHSEAHLFRGVALQRLGYYREAYACFDRALGKAEQLSVWDGIGDKLRQLLTLVAVGHQVLRQRLFGDKEGSTLNTHHLPLK